MFLLKSLVRITNALGLSCLGLQHLSELGVVCADSRVDIIIVCPSLLQQSAATPGVLGFVAVCLSLLCCIVVVCAPSAAAAFVCADSHVDIIIVCPLSAACRCCRK